MKLASLFPENDLDGGSSMIHLKADYLCICKLKIQIAAYIVIQYKKQVQAYLALECFTNMALFIYIHVYCF